MADVLGVCPACCNSRNQESYDRGDVDCIEMKVIKQDCWLEDISLESIFSQRFSRNSWMWLETHLKESDRKLKFWISKGVSPWDFGFRIVLDTGVKILLSTIKTLATLISGGIQVEIKGYKNICFEMDDNLMIRDNKKRIMRDVASPVFSTICLCSRI